MGGVRQWCGGDYDLAKSAAFLLQTGSTKATKFDSGEDALRHEATGLDTATAAEQDDAGPQDAEPADMSTTEEQALLRTLNKVYEPAPEETGAP